MAAKLSLADLRKASFDGREPSIEAVQKELFDLTGVWTEHARGAKPNYHSVSSATKVIQNLDTNFSHLGGPSGRR